MANTYKLIDSRSLTSSTGSVIFSAIPQTYTDLILNISAKDGRSDYADDLKITINANTSATYSNVRGFGSAPSSTSADGGSGAWSAGYSYNGFVTGSTNSADRFGVASFLFTNYTDNTRLKGWTHDSGNGGLSSANQFQLGMGGGQTSDTNPITIIKLEGYNSGTLEAGSTFYLYGISNT